jgi:hypothetical protein
MVTVLQTVIPMVVAMLAVTVPMLGVRLIERNYH